MGCKNTGKHLISKSNQKTADPLCSKENIDEDQDQGKNSPSPDLEPPVIFTSLLHTFSQDKSIG